MQKRDSKWFNRQGAMVVAVFFLFLAFITASVVWQTPQLIYWAWALQFLALMFMFNEVEAYLENIAVTLEENERVRIK